MEIFAGREVARETVGEAAGHLQSSYEAVARNASWRLEPDLEQHPPCLRTNFSIMDIQVLLGHESSVDPSARVCGEVPC